MGFIARLCLKKRSKTKRNQKDYLSPPHSGSTWNFSLIFTVRTCRVLGGKAEKYVKEP
jgi:hypothetical protein